jgi:PAS domain S-box-containing protein
LLFIAVISFFLQKLISTPVMALIASVKQVSEKKDYAIRVKKQSDDELGVLVDAFNEMLAQIQESDSALRESGEQLNTLLQSIQAAVVVHGPDTNIIKCNKTSQELLGLTENQMLGKESIDPYWKFLNENGSDMSLENYPANQVKNKKNALKNFIVGVCRPNKNDVVWVLVNAVPEYGSDGNISQVIVTFMDITDRKHAENELLFKKNIIMSSSSIIATCDLEGSMTYGNPSFLKTWGFEDSKEFLGRHFSEFWVVKDRLDEIMETLLGKGKWLGEIKAKRKDGTLFDVQISAAAIFDGKGNPIALTSTSIDITERKQAEEEIKKLRGILPLCSYCKKIRDDDGHWEQVDVYIYKHSEADISHSICPECMKKHYPEYASIDSDKNKD